MSKVNIVVAADIGSTRTHLAAVDTREPSCLARADFNNAEFDARFVPAIESIVAAYPRIRAINISSCVKELGANALELCAAKDIFDSTKIVTVRKNEVAFARYDNKRGINGAFRQTIRINYDTPETLGADRLCNAIACAAMFDDEDCVIVDAGTAVTVDLLRAGSVFEGGAIMPGLSMQLSALHRDTDSLPHVKIHGGSSDPLGTSTVDCVRVGVVYGTTGAVERLISEYRGGGAAKVVITGGDGQIISEMIRGNTTVVPNLTLIGAGIYSDM